MSNHNNNAPFHVGQRVVCVDDKNQHTISPPKRVKKGCEYIIEKWLPETPDTFEGVILKGNNAKFLAYRFAPIEPRHQDVDIADELLVEPVEERVDVLKTPAHA